MARRASKKTNRYQNLWMWALIVALICIVVLLLISVTWALWKSV
jgi:hypothetical protein